MLGLTSPSTDSSPAVKGRVHLIAVAAFGVVASAGVFAVTLHLEHSHAESQFLEIAEQRMMGVTVDVHGAIDTVALVASHFEASGAIGHCRESFARLVAPVLSNHRYLQALEWIPLVRDSERSEYERRARADGIQSFQFTELQNGARVPAARRAQYFPVFYVRPLATNEQALGYDLGSNPVRLAAMLQARDTGRLTASARVRLVQETSDQWGVLMFAPVYQHPGLVNVTERQDDLQGFALSVVRIGDLLEASQHQPWRPYSLPAVNLHLFDLSATGSAQQMFPRPAVTTPEKLRAGVHAQQAFEVGGRTWLLIATPVAGAAVGRSWSSYAFVLPLGLLVTVVYLRYLAARIAQAAAITQSAADLQRAQAELQQTNEVLKAVIECSPLAVVTRDLEGKVTMWNPAAVRMHGWTPEEVIGRPLPVTLLHVPPDETRLVHERILREGSVACKEYVALTKDRTPISVSVSGAPLHNAAGERSGAVYLVMDITERKALERQLAQAQKLESVGQLAAGVAHEINTPIQFVGDNLRFLQDSFETQGRLFAAYKRLQSAVRDGLPAADIAAECDAIAEEIDLEYLLQEIPKAHQQSIEGADRVAKIVRAMKEFSYFGGEGKIAVDINRAIESTVLVSRNEWKYVAEMQTDFAPDLPVVNCNSQEFNQVILNLIINAAHAIGDAVNGKPDTRGEITISTRCAGDSVEIRVRDTGTGIPENVQPHIFNPFFTTKPVGKGSGQGLAIAHSVVVQKHGGSISFDTEIGVGTTFIVRLPIAGSNGSGHD